MIKIPLNIEPAQTLKVVLAGQNCEIKIYYRFGATFMDLTCNNEVIQQGAICTNLSSIIQRATDKFKGYLFFVDVLGDNPPYYTGFGDRFSLLYVAENEDIPAGLMI